MSDLVNKINTGQMLCDLESTLTKRIQEFETATGLKVCEVTVMHYHEVDNQAGAIEVAVSISRAYR